MTLKLKQDLILREIAGEFIVVPVGTMTVDMRCMIKLNESGAFLWKQLEHDKTKEQLVAALLDEYDVSDGQATDDVDRFIALMTEAGILE